MNIIVFEKKGLSLERLHLLCEVAICGGIKAAVGNDTTRQSLASRQLKELSEYAGCELFRRNGRHLEMTEEGRKLSDIGIGFFKQMESFLLSVNNLPMRFDLGVGDSIFQWQILPHMKEFQQQIPNVQLISFSYSTHEIIHKVEINTLDAGIVRKTAIGQTDMTVEDIGEISYKLFIPQTLASGNGRNLPTLSAIPLCTLTGDGEYAQSMSKLATSFRCTPALSCSSMTQMYAAVESGQYAAILPEQAENSLAHCHPRCYSLPELTSFKRRIALIYKPTTLKDDYKQKTIAFLRSVID